MRLWFLSSCAYIATKQFSDYDNSIDFLLPRARILQLRPGKGAPIPYGFLLHAVSSQFFENCLNRSYALSLCVMFRHGLPYSVNRSIYPCELQPNVPLNASRAAHSHHARARELQLGARKELKEEFSHHSHVRGQ